MPKRIETLAKQKEDVLRVLIAICANLRALQKKKNGVKAYLEVEKMLERELSKAGRR